MNKIYIKCSYCEEVTEIKIETIKVDKKLWWDDWNEKWCAEEPDHYCASDETYSNDQGCDCTRGNGCH